MEGMQQCGVQNITEQDKVLSLAALQVGHHRSDALADFLYIPKGETQPRTSSQTGGLRLLFLLALGLRCGCLHLGSQSSVGKQVCVGDAGQLSGCVRFPLGDAVKVGPESRNKIGSAVLH